MTPHSKEQCRLNYKNDSLAEECIAKDEHRVIDSIEEAPAGKIDEHSISRNEETSMINEHYNYILSQIICPDFKAMVNWHNLSKEHVKIEESSLK